MRKNRDVLWKLIIEEVFDDLLRFVFPQADELFDLKRGFGFLDKELAELYPEPGKPSATRLADKLIQVYRKDGKPEWLLVHLEVQGHSEQQFRERMFRYFYRILDRWRYPVTAIAILTGSEGSRIPDCYHYSCVGTELHYRYNVLRVKDFRDEDLSTSTNPFAAVMLIVKKALLEGKMSEKELIRQKLAVARALMGRKDIPRRKVEAILRFLNNYIVFKEPGNNDVFKRQFEHIIKKENSMGIIEYFALEEFMKERRKIARKLLSMNHLPADKIAYATGLSVKEVERMQKSRSSK